MQPLWAHQQEALDLTAEREAAALFMEQRTGKSRVVLETAARLAKLGRADALLIVAPNGVHVNWATIEVPTWLPQLSRPPVALRARMLRTKSGREALDDLLAAKTFVVLAVNVEALDATKVRAYLERFLALRRAIAVVDESQTIKTPTADRTKRALKLGRLARYRRVLSGTPNPESPFELWSQFNFLDPAILPESYFTFTHRYAEFETKFMRDPATGARREYPSIKGYRYLDELAERIAPHTFRKLRSECADLPPVVRQARRFVLGPEARRLYDELRKEYVLETEDGRVVDGRHVLTRMLRLQQIACNLLVTSAGQRECQACRGKDPECPDCLGWGFESTPATRTFIAARDARTEALVEELRQASGQAVVWCRFRPDVGAVAGRLAEEFGGAIATVDGSTSAEARATAVAAFQKGVARFLVGNPAVGGRGLDMSAADLVVYYSNYFSLEIRLQSEDRPINLSKKRSIGIVDLVADDTVDEKIVEAHAEKKDLKEMVMRNPSARWLS